MATKLVLSDSLDPMIRSVQRRKAQVLDEIPVGGGNKVARSDFIVNEGGVCEEASDDELLLETECTNHYDVIVGTAEEVRTNGGRKCIEPTSGSQTSVKYWVEFTFGAPRKLRQIYSRRDPIVCEFDLLP